MCFFSFHGISAVFSILKGLWVMWSTSCNARVLHSSGRFSPARTRLYTSTSSVVATWGLTVVNIFLLISRDLPSNA